MSEQNAAVGIYDTHTGAEAAIKELQRSSFKMKQLSIVGRGYHTEEQVIGFYRWPQKAWGKLGGLCSGRLFVLRGFGPVMVFGPMVAWIVGALGTVQPSWAG